MKVLVDSPHGISTLGKCSPDKRLQEWKYSRELAKGIVYNLSSLGIETELIVPEDIDVNLLIRCRRVNNVCYKLGKSNVLLISPHVDAIGTDGKWHDCGGWSAFTSKGETKSDKCAEFLYESAEKFLKSYIDAFPERKARGLYGQNQRPIRTDKSDGDKDFEANFTILHNTLCPAVLTENLFQDNRTDVDYLLSKSGQKSIIDLHVEGIVNYIKWYKNL